MRRSFQHPIRWLLFMALFLALTSGVPTLHAQDDSQPDSQDDSAPAPAPAPTSITGSLTVDGHARTYTLTIPAAYNAAQDAEPPIPLVIALHTFASSGKAMQALTGFDDLAARDGFFVVYPDSFDLNWNDGAVDSAQADRPSALQYTDDVGYITALIDHLTETYAIDPARVYLTGFGHGGALAYRLACAIPDRLAKVAVVGELPWDYHVAACGDTVDGADPVSVLMLWGDADDYYYPVAGNLKLTAALVEEIDHLSPADAAAFWAARNGCDLDATLTVPDDRQFTVYDSCVDGATVAVYTLAGVGHNWLRTGDYVLNQYDLDMSELIARYFMSDLSGAAAWSDLLMAPAPVASIYGGTPRSYTVYVPTTYDGTEPLPLVYALHGRPHNGAGYAYLLDFNRVAEENGFIVVYPDGFHEEWNYYSGIIPAADDQGADDVAFLTTLIDDLAVDLKLDRTRLYVSGFSNGGFMTQRLACEPGHPFAAFAVVGATMTPELEIACDEARLTPILLMHGTHDRSVPWDGLMTNNLVMTRSVPDTIRFWGIRNQCDPNQISYQLLPLTHDNAPTVVFDYTIGGCQADLQYYVIEGGGHNLPGVPNRLNEVIAGAVNEDIHAGTAIWEFLAQYSQ